jgi:hypothetical protein
VIDILIGSGNREVPWEAADPDIAGWRIVGRCTVESCSAHGLVIERDGVRRALYFDRTACAFRVVEISPAV